MYIRRCKLFYACSTYFHQLGLHQYVAPHNIQELQEIHANARPTAVAYVSTIFLLYLIGLGVILVHYMNSSYGSWTWNLDDLWEELRPAFSKPKPKWESKSRGEYPGYQREIGSQSLIKLREDERRL